MPQTVKLELALQDIQTILSLLRQVPMAWEVSDPLLRKINTQLTPAAPKLASSEATLPQTANAA